MKNKKILEKIKGTVNKIGKRNIVVICSVLLIGAAIYLNWTLFADDGEKIAGDDPAGGTLTQNVSDTLGADDADEAYFAASIVSRQRARDEAMEVLQSVLENSAAQDSVKNQALGDISRIALDIEREANIETLIKSKGFEDCVAVVSGTTANIIVKSDGLLANEIAQITEIVYEQAGIIPENIKIVEKK